MPGRFPVFLLTDSQASRAKARAVAAAASAGRRARRAAGQAGPMAASARTAARTGIRHTRVWAAPRLDRTGYALEDQVAPRMAAMLSAAAQRIDPAPVRRRRWPVLAAGLIAATGLSATAAYLLKRRAAANAPESSAPESSAPDDAAGTTMPAEVPSDPAASDANGRVHTG